MLKKLGGNKSSRSKALRRADTAFSLFIRTRDSQQYDGLAFKCISCGRVLPIEQADNGHYINRAHLATRFSELNCNAQCRHCNRFDEGNIQGYRRGLTEKIGEPNVEMLEALKYTTNKLSTFELEQIAKHYVEKTKAFKYQINKKWR